jgi:ubiquinone biosynthesis accessory factor UbiJ
MAYSITEQLERLVNRLLQQDQETLRAMSSLSGKVIAIEILGVDVTLFLEFGASGLGLKYASKGKPDVTIKGGPVSLVGLLLSKDVYQPGSSGEMEITGDVGLAQRFQAIMKNVEIDWEENLSGWVGDTAARKLGNLFRSIRQFASGAAQTIRMDISEYLKYEKEILPDRPEVDEFIVAVDVIRDDAERFWQRIARLERKIVQKV